jgi:ketosteroid isomerase-like protein
MSQEIKDRVRRCYAAINRDDFEAAVEALEPMDSEIEYIPPAVMPETRSYRGREAMKRRIIELSEPFEKRDSQLVEFIESGERTLADVHMKGQGRGSSAPFEGHLYQVITTRGPNQTVIRIENFFDRREALEAAGISE